MKTLVCVMGQLRLTDLTWPSFKKFVLDELGADLLVCGPDSHKDNPYARAAKYKVLSEADIAPGARNNAAAVVQHRRNLYLEAPLDYDRYILTRSDHIWTGPHPELAPDTCWFMNCEFHFGISDRHWVLPVEYLKRYCQETGNFESKFRNIEEYLYQLVEWGPRTGLAYFPMYLAGLEGEHRRPDELDAPKQNFTWPFQIDHAYLSLNGMFCGRVYK
jgi:hypothetical protein